MKKAKDKYASISDLANEFHVNKAAIELYGVHGLLPPISSKTTRPVYRLIDKVRLKFITRAKNADYTIGNIKELIGVLDLKKDEADQMEESLVYSKKKSAELTSSLEELDALEQINITCDLELLEAYITDLTNLKYGWNDISSTKTALPVPETIASHVKPRMPVYSPVADQIKTGAPAITPKKSRTPLIAVVGGILVAISVYLYFGGDPVPDIADNSAAPIQMESAEITPATVASNEAEEIYLSETETSLNKADEIYPSETDLNPDESGDPLADEHNSKEDLFSQLDFPALKNELNSLSADPMESGLETDSDEQSQDTKTTQSLLDDINKSDETTPNPGMPEKEETEDVFFKQLVADLKKKYDEQAQSQKPATNDIIEIDAAPEKMSEKNETQNLVAKTVSNDAPQANKTTAASETLKETESKSITAATKPPLKKATTTPPKTAASSVVTKRQPSTSTRAKPPTTKSPKSSSPVAVIKKSTKKTTVPAKKVKTPKLPPSDESVSKAITPPKPKPQTAPPKPANPEALKWAQKSYESVMNGDVGEAIVTASVALTLDPGMVNAYINRSWAYSKKGQYDKAIHDCDKALDIDKKNALAYNNRGLAFQGKGDMDRAKADYERACKLGLDIGCKNYQEVINLATK